MVMVNPVLYIVSGLLVGLEALLALMIYFEVKAASDTAMASFQLNKEDVITEFKLMILSGLPLIVGGAVYALGAYIGNSFLKNFGYTGGIVTTLILDYVLYRWWRRF